MDIHQDINCKVVRTAGWRKRTIFTSSFTECEYYLLNRAEKERRKGNRAYSDKEFSSLLVSSPKNDLLYTLQISDVS